MHIERYPNFVVALPLSLPKSPRYLVTIQHVPLAAVLEANSLKALFSYFL